MHQCRQFQQLETVSRNNSLCVQIPNELSEQDYRSSACGRSAIQYRTAKRIELPLQAGTEGIVRGGDEHSLQQQNGGNGVA